MIKEWLQSYNCTSLEENEQALREIMQEITLAGLYRTNFFQQAAFYGGTALRIFHGLDRFSEDLDFSLLQKNNQFEIQPYFNSIKKEFESVGIHISIHQKIKSTKTNIDSAFLKSETLWSELVFEETIYQLPFNLKPTLKIKLEIDTTPPLGFTTENLLLLKPFSFYVNCMVKEDLFAGKLHALLFRQWKNRVKGRDWYDLEWYVRNNIPLNLKHFLNRANESNHISSCEIDRQQIISLITNKILKTNIQDAKQDIIRFIPNPEALDIWSTEYFIDLANKIKIYS